MNIDKIEYRQKPSIKIPHELKGLLDNLKLVPSERYEDVIKRLTEQTMESIKQMDKELNGK